MEDAIERILQKRKKSEIRLKDFRPSAVLVPVFKKESEDHLLFTLRNDQVRHHKGEICFPGGTFDEEDKNLLTTALREAEEELGIQKKDIKILGELDEIITPTFFRIAPFVGRIPFPYPLKINQQEISEVLEIPLSHFFDEKRLRTERVEHFGETFEIPYYEWKNHTVWGATGRIVRQLVETLKKGL